MPWDHDVVIIVTQFHDVITHSAILTDAEMRQEETVTQTGNSVEWNMNRQIFIEYFTEKKKAVYHNIVQVPHLLKMSLN